MAEQQLSKTLMRHLKTVGHAERIENMSSVGAPDVNYCINAAEGHIENKWLLSWPKRTPHERIVHLRHYTAAQRRWALLRAKAGGRVFVLLQVQQPHHDYLLFDGAWAATHLGRCTMDEMLANALVHGRGYFPWPGIFTHLTKERS